MRWLRQGENKNKKRVKTIKNSYLHNGITGTLYLSCRHKKWICLMRPIEAVWWKIWSPKSRDTVSLNAGVWPRGHSERLQRLQQQVKINLHRICFSLVPQTPSGGFSSKKLSKMMVPLRLTKILQHKSWQGFFYWSFWRTWVEKNIKSVLAWESLSMSWPILMPHLRRGSQTALHPGSGSFSPNLDHHNMSKIIREAIQ